MAERPRDSARRLRKAALASGKEARKDALALARQARKEAMTLARSARREAMAQASDAMAQAFEPLTQERRRAMTREHLLEAAAMVFARDGFHGASLDDIAATAGFTKGAVYSNFKSKEDLLLAVMDERISQQFDEIIGALDTEHRTQAEQLPRIASTVAAHLWDDTWTMLYLEFVLYAARNPEAQEKMRRFVGKSREIVADMVEKEYAATGLAPKYPPEQIAVISTAMFDGLGLYHLIDPSSTRDETIHTLLELMYNAMGVSDEDEAGNADA